MSVFGAYSAYYDLLYKDKDYAGEAAYVTGLIRRVAPRAVSVLELGCGTGAHAALLAGQGWRVHCIDSSDAMLAIAESRRSTLPADVAGLLSFAQGDVRSYRFSQRFDAVVSLFHVASYQTSHQDLDGFMATAGAHLKEEGIFIFDFWYGPAVLAERPAIRVKRLADERIRLVRVAEPILHPNLNRVDVNYQIILIDQVTGAVEEVAETHAMRYLFLPEVALLLEKHGFASWTAEEWLTGREAGLDTWGVCVIARK